MPITRTTTTTEHTLTKPTILTDNSIRHSVVVEQATIIEITDGEQRPFRQVFVHGYVIDTEGQRTGARVFQQHVTDPSQRTDLLAHIAQEN